MKKYFIYEIFIRYQIIFVIELYWRLNKVLERPKIRCYLTSPLISLYLYDYVVSFIWKFDIIIFVAVKKKIL